MRSACKRGTENGHKHPKGLPVYNKSVSHGHPSVNAANGTGTDLGMQRM